MTTRRRPRELTGLLPFPPQRASVSAAVSDQPRVLPSRAREFAADFNRVNERAREHVRCRVERVAAIARRRRTAFYLDVAGAAAFMALFVVAALLV